MAESPSENPITPAEVRCLGGRAVGRSEGAAFAGGRRCRHQLADPATAASTPTDVPVHANVRFLRLSVGRVVHRDGRITVE